MGRGLGYRQRIALQALKAMEQERGPGWRTPAEMLATLDAMTGAGVNRAVEYMARADALQLEHARGMVARGVLSFRVAVQAIEARIAEREAWRRREAMLRAPNTLRRKARAGENANPSRVLAGLERRGLVERQAHCGPGSAVRLAVKD